MPALKSNLICTHLVVLSIFYNHVELLLALLSLNRFIMKLNSIDWIAIVLVIVGAINWGLVGIFQFDLVDWLFVQLLTIEVLATIVYILVGVAGLYMIATVSKVAKK